MRRIACNKAVTRDAVCSLSCLQTSLLAPNSLESQRHEYKLINVEINTQSIERLTAAGSPTKGLGVTPYPVQRLLPTATTVAWLPPLVPHKEDSWLSIRDSVDD
jgi:hypothetical protein